MEVDSSIVSGMYALAVLSTVLMGYIVWQHRRKPGAVPLLVSFFGGGIWAGCLLLATLIDDYTLSVWLSKTVFIGVVIIVAGIFVFALEYTGREHLVNKYTIGLLSIEPVIVVTLAFLNPGDLFFASLAPDPTMATGVGGEWGPAFWVHFLYSYALSIATAGLIFELLYRSRALYRGQMLVLILAVLLPTGANLVHTVGPVPFDSTPIGFIGANALFAVAVIRYQFIDLVPIARDRVLDNVGDAVFVIDSDRRIVDVNPAGEALLKPAVDKDVVGDDISTLDDVSSELGSLFGESVEETTERKWETTVRGRHYVAESTAIDDGRGRHVGWLLLVRDITERKEREEELRRRNEQLDQFASVVSHDLRNPLSIARGFTDITRETGDVSNLDRVEEAHDRMDAIIEDVLALAREGKAVTDPEPVELGAVAEEAWKTVDTGGCELRIATDATVLADRKRLSRLFENLFRNAVEHGTDCEAVADCELDIEIGTLNEGFYVEDDGVGIPEADRETIFESGYSTGEGGTGFGLSIVRGIANAHGWTVTVSDGNTGGARFEFIGVTFADD